MDFEESVQNSPHRYEKMYDETQAMTARTLGFIENWRVGLGKAL